jgi:predicted LPLAT superfamily acyltransferase
MAWAALTLGRAATRLLLYPICLYFMVASPKSVRASRNYLTRIGRRRARWREIFQHHFYFAAALLDRAYIFAGQFHRFEFYFHGKDAIREALRHGRGCLVVGAHVGSFELLRALATQERFTVNMMMHEDNAPQMATVQAELDTRQERRIIRIGDIHALLTAKERLDAGELVGLLADRTLGQDRAVRVPFLGKPAEFPTGPWLAAAALKVPVVLVFCLYAGKNRYEFHFEPFCQELSLDRRDTDRLAAWVEQYAQRLEHTCRRSPYNWFNFYDFWAEHDANATPSKSNFDTHGG